MYENFANFADDDERYSVFMFFQACVMLFWMTTWSKILPEMNFYDKEMLL